MIAWPADTALQIAATDDLHIAFYRPHGKTSPVDDPELGGRIDAGYPHHHRNGDSRG